LAWTTPLTAASNTALTAAQWNASVRDNLLTTAPGLASVAGSIFAATGTNAIAQRTPVTNTNLGAGSVGTTTSTSYVQALTGTTLPQVAATSGVKALIAFSTRQTAATAGQNMWTSVAVSGATTIAASDNWAMSWDGTGQHYYCMTYLETSLTAGSNTFTMQARVSSGTATFSTQRISVVPF
jgi:hypothetical protein